MSSKQININKKEAYVVLLENPTKVINEKASLIRWYENLIDFYGGKLPIVSPASWPKWAQEHAHWLCKGEKVAEIGCGDGGFAQCVLSVAKELGQSAPREIYITDLAPGVLKAAKLNVKPFIEALKQNNSMTKVFMKPADAECLSESSFLRDIDRIIAINVFGDTRVEQALTEVHKILKDGDLLCGTFYSKETYDEFWENHRAGEYLSDAGMWFTPIDFYGHAPSLKEMGTLVVPLKGGSELTVKYVRIQRYNTKEGWTRILEEAGFQLAQEPSRVWYPKELVLDKWANQLSKRQKALLDKWKGFPEVWEFVVRKVRKK